MNNNNDNNVIFKKVEDMQKGPDDEGQVGNGEGSLKAESMGRVWGSFCEVKQFPIAVDFENWNYWQSLI